MLRLSRRMMVAAGSGPFDPYKILGVTQNASKDEIKKAYHKLALRFHPDSGAEGNTERFAAVNEAYEAVKDGKWKASAEQQQTTAEASGGGWDARRRMYVYEQPGSTTEGYVSGDTEKFLRLFMVGCFLFVVVRVTLFSMRPSRKREETYDDAANTAAGGSSGADGDGTSFSFSGEPTSEKPFPPLPGEDAGSGGAARNSIHRDDDVDFKWNYGAPTTPMKDPLSHR